MTYNVLGLDLSLTAAGLAVIDSRERLLAVAVCATDPKDGSRIERMDWIAETVIEHVSRFNPSLIIIEDYAYSRPTSVATLGELGGIVKLALWRHTGVSECWMTVTSSECKKFVTGSAASKGGKERMIAAAQPYYDEYERRTGCILPPKMRANDNAADALGLTRLGLVKFPV